MNNAQSVPTCDYILLYICCPWVLCPAAMSAARTERLLNLYTFLLNASHPQTLADLCVHDEFRAYRGPTPKSGERAFERDKAALIALGVALTYTAVGQDDRAPGYAIDRNQHALPLQQMGAQDMAMASIVAAGASSMLGYAHNGALHCALLKLGFDTEPADAQAPVLAHMPWHTARHPEASARLHDILLDAVAYARRVQLTYGQQVRRVEPWGMFYRLGSWYLTAWCCTRQDRRTFHLDRITQAQPVGHADAFLPPEQLDMVAIAQTQAWEYGRHPPLTVPIWVHPDLVPAIPEIFGQAKKTLVVGPPGSDGAVVVTATVRNHEALMQTVLPYGARAEVLGPPWLRAKLAALYTAIAQRHLEPQP